VFYTGDFIQAGLFFLVRTKEIGKNIIQT